MKKRIVSKCKEEPKMFLKFLNGKLKRNGVIKLKEGGVTYEKDKELAEVLNKNFQ